MRIFEFSSCLVSQDETRGLRSGLRRHVSWFVVATTGVVSLSANAGCTKHIFGVGQDAPKGVSTAARVGHGVVRVPRRALEIQPYRDAGQCVDSKLRAHLSPPTCLLAGAGEAVRDVLVMARLDARAAVAEILLFAVLCEGPGPGVNQT